LANSALRYFVFPFGRVPLDLSVYVVYLGKIGIGLVMIDKMLMGSESFVILDCATQSIIYSISAATVHNPSRLPSSFTMLKLRLY